MLFRKGDFFVTQDVFRMIFKGSILGGACHFWCDPYLNSLLFDIPLYMYEEIACDTLIEQSKFQ